MPAPASKTVEQVSPMKSDDTTCRGKGREGGERVRRVLCGKRVGGRVCGVVWGCVVWRKGGEGCAHLVLGVADDALRVRLRGELDLRLDVVVRRRGLELAGEVDDRDVDGRHTEGHAGELALHHRVALGDGLGGAGRRRDDVRRGGAAGTPVGALEHAWKGGGEEGGM